MPHRAWKILKVAIDQWFTHRSARLGAALAYYSVFSMGPLLLIVISIAGLFFGADAVRGSLTSQFRSMLGESGSKAVEAMLAGASSPQTRRLAAITGIVLLLIAALGVVSQLKDAMNTIWNVNAGAILHRRAGAKIHHRIEQEGPRSGAFLLSQLNPEEELPG